MEKVGEIQEVLDGILRCLWIRDIETMGRCNMFFREQIFQSRIYQEKIQKFMFLLQKHDEYIRKRHFNKDPRLLSKINHEDGNLKKKFLFPCMVGNYGTK